MYFCGYVFLFKECVVILDFFFADEGNNIGGTSASMPPLLQPSTTETAILPPLSMEAEGEAEEVGIIIPTEELVPEHPSPSSTYREESEGVEFHTPSQNSSMGIEDEPPVTRGMANLAVNDGAREDAIGTSLPIVGVTEASPSMSPVVSTMAISVVSEPFPSEGRHAGVSGTLPPQILRLVERV